MANRNNQTNRYKNLYGYRAGYLPRCMDVVDEWHEELNAALAARKGPVKLSKAVAKLAELIDRDPIIRMYCKEMIWQQYCLKPRPPESSFVRSIDEMLLKLNHISRTAPPYNKRHKGFFPVSNLFVYLMMTPAGEAIFRNRQFNDALRAILKEWCHYLDHSKSLGVINRGPHGWLSPSAWEYNKLDEFVIPKPKEKHGGFKSFNDYFHREIKLECRPLAGADNDPKTDPVIVSANDGRVYNYQTDVRREDDFWIKGQPYSLIDMLDHSSHVKRFEGGTVLQSFLSGADYHRWRSPVSGKVVERRVVEALMFSDAESAGYDPTAATYSQGYQSAVNTRGLVFIEADNPKIGLVCVIPIGITEISSVSINVKKNQPIKKGGELGWFSYGGSSMALVFQPGAVKKFTIPGIDQPHGPDDGPPIQVRAQIAEAG